MRYIHNTMCDICVFVAETARLRKEAEIQNDKQERAKDGLNTKLMQTEKDLQLALRQEQQSHEEDVERISKEKVRQLTCCQC